MSNPSIESSSSLTDLFEYDEYDSYENPYAEIDTSSDCDDGIPLSVELSESLRRQCADELSQKITSSCADIDTDANQHFVRAPEIFLRIDNNDVAATTTTPGDASATTDASTKIKKTECDRTVGSIESSGSDVSEVPAIGCDIVELHYENEFIDANADDDDINRTTACQRSTTQFENDNEQLLFEGMRRTQYNQISLVLYELKRVE